MMPVASEKLRTVAINTLRRPMRSAIHPQKKAPGIDPTPAAKRITPDWINVSFHCVTMKTSTYPIRKKSKKSSISPRMEAVIIFHWFNVRLFLLLQTLQHRFVSLLISTTHDGTTVVVNCRNAIFVEFLEETGAG